MCIRLAVCLCVCVTLLAKKSLEGVKKTCGCRGYKYNDPSAILPEVFWKRKFAGRWLLVFHGWFIIVLPLHNRAEDLDFSVRLCILYICLRVQWEKVSAPHASFTVCAFWGDFFFIVSRRISQRASAIVFRVGLSVRMSDSKSWDTNEWLRRKFDRRELAFSKSTLIRSSL